MQWCTACDRGLFYPRTLCPHCGARGAARVAGGERTGHVHAAVVEHRPESAGAAFAQGEPFCIALVDLQEGVRMMTNVVGCPPDDVSIGMAVTVSWEPLSDGRQLPLFRPAGPQRIHGEADPPAKAGRRREHSRGQARRRGRGHAAGLVGPADPGSPGAGHRARRPHLRRSQRRHQPVVPRPAGPRPATRRRHRPDVRQRARVLGGALRRSAHGPPPHAHQLAPDR